MGVVEELTEPLIWTIDSTASGRALIIADEVDGFSTSFEGVKKFRNGLRYPFDILLICTDSYLTRADATKHLLPRSAIGDKFVCFVRSEDMETGETWAALRDT